MVTVIYNTENGIFNFDLSDVLIMSNFYARQHGADEANDLLDFLKSATTDPLKVPGESAGLFGHISLDLISQHKGSAFCKICQKTYRADQLQSITVGHGKTPFSVEIKKKGGIKKLFSRKRKMPRMFGGKGYECPEGHELISMVTWRT